MFAADRVMTPEIGCPTGLQCETLLLLLTQPPHASSQTAINHHSTSTSGSLWHFVYVTGRSSSPREVRAPGTQPGRRAETGATTSFSDNLNIFLTGFQYHSLWFWGFELIHKLFDYSWWQSVSQEGRKSCKIFCYNSEFTVWRVDLNEHPHIKLNLK